MAEYTAAACLLWPIHARCPPRAIQSGTPNANAIESAPLDGCESSEESIGAHLCAYVCMYGCMYACLSLRISPLGFPWDPERVRVGSLWFESGVEGQRCNKRMQSTRGLRTRPDGSP